MGLKAFHIFFISITSLTFFALGAWRASLASGQGGAAVAQAAVSFVTGAALLFYGVRFLRKLRGIGYM